ncbi:MAG: hypothetical protein J6V55_06505 [Alistipes sp.]|nr:hypothetical protein [Alistipes sp.]
MRLIMSKECEVLTTPKIMEIYYPELWERVCNQEDRLRNIQNEIVKVLPEWKKRLANSVEELVKSRDAQLDLQYYITLRALYLFAHKVWSKLYELCETLPNPECGKDRYTEDDLNGLLSKLEDAGLEDLLNADDEDVLIRLAKIVESITHDVVRVVGCWSLRDITRGNTYSPNLCHPDLLPSALSAEDFAEVNIGKIAADDKIRATAID